MSINELVSKRDQARKDKNYTESDNLRKQIEELGYTVQDTPTGTKVTAKPKYEYTPPDVSDLMERSTKEYAEAWLQKQKEEGNL